MATSKPAPGKSDAVQANAIRVRAFSERGFRRAGIRFEREPKTILLKDLTETQIEQIRGEPQLASEFITVAEEAGDTANT
jgi:hypothetical protein